MKQFSDLLDIEFTITVAITLQPIVENGAPLIRMICNDSVLFDNQLWQEQTWTHAVKLLDHIDLCIELHDKTYSEAHETAVIIKSMMIDRFEIVPSWTHLATYQNDQNNRNPTAYLGFNGVWQFKIDEPFYRWHHRVTGQGWLLEPTT
jgi:hypothetical protein